MKVGPDIATIAALLGDPARANMLTALLAGQALTAGELAREAGVTAQTASSHLARLEAGGLLTQRKQGRHRYYALSGEDVAGVLEALMGLAARTGHTRMRTGPKEPALRQARVCYDHLAGDLAVAMLENLVATRPGRRDRRDPDADRHRANLHERARPRPAGDDHLAPAAVQGLPRLERAPHPPGRGARRGPARPLLRLGLGGPRARHAAGPLHATRP